MVGYRVQCPKEKAHPISLQIPPDCTGLSPTGWSPQVCAMGRMGVFFQIMVLPGALGLCLKEKELRSPGL